jgi:hypothetical protein
MGNPDNAHHIITFCDWCGKMIQRSGSYTKEKKKKYIACKPECQKKLSQVFQSKEWLDLSEKEKNLFKYGVRTWYEKQEEASMLKAKKYFKVAKPSQMAKAKRHVPKKSSTILKAHDEAMKDDPERLSSTFITNILGERNSPS